jgi:hypothetical protein
MTTTSMIVKSVPLLIGKIMDYRKHNPKITLRANFLTGTPILHPSTFGRKMWTNDLEKILSVWPNETQQDRNAMQEFKGIFDSIPTEMPDEKMLRYFKHFLDQLDKRRNTDWRKVLPHLDI